MERGMEYQVLEHWSSLLQHLMYRGSRSLSHQARDDQGLGFRRSGVLPSHARRNGSLPGTGPSQFRAWVALASARLNMY